MKIVDYLKHNRIICPNCGSEKFFSNGNINKGNAACRQCRAVYPFFGMVGQFIHNQNPEDTLQIQEFWKELYHAAYKDHDQIGDKDEFQEKLQELENLFITKQHLSVNEMPINNLEGKKVLEIGSGAGAYSSLFALKGAQITAIDITLDRVISTARKLSILSDAYRCCSMQANAEQLPFASNTFDIVYSNGVLHHTHDTEKSISEIHRVLNSNGIAVIMLYAKHSYLYWVNLFLIKGLLFGQIFRGKNWLGAVTEWMSNDKQKVFNPVTKVYSHKQLRRMFSNFQNVEIRKGGFVFDQLPLIGPLISKVLSRYTGYNQSGLLVYSKPWRNDTKLELRLSRLIGFANNIRARKKLLNANMRN